MEKPFPLHYRYDHDTEQYECKRRNSMKVGNKKADHTNNRIAKE